MECIDGLWAKIDTMPVLKRLSLTLSLCLLVNSPALAGKEEGMTAYEQGRYGVALDELTGVAFKGDKEASLLVGLMYLRAQGTEKDLTRAVYWFQESAKQGSAEAYGHLAELYLTGSGLPQSDMDAFYNADAAAQGGYVPAQTLLGKLYLEGRGIERDPEQARHWFTQAAESKNAEAAYRLGQLLETGEGGSEDLPAALKWYQAAAGGGYKAASEALQRLRPATVPTSVVSTAKVNLPAPITAPQTIAHQRRIALLIANQDYQGGIGDLRGPVNDVQLLAKVLTQAGFQVTTNINLGLSDLKQEVMQFLDSVDGNTVSLLYYSGHGVEMDGRNYLLPTDFKDKPGLTQNQAEELSFDIAAAYARMTAQAEGSLNITILDACRDNPFRVMGKGIGSVGGLKGLDIPAGKDGTIETFTAYAAESGQTARDDYPNSPYATALASQIPVPGQVLEVMFRNVRQQVVLSTNYTQRPTTYAGLSSEFVFTPKK